MRPHLLALLLVVLMGAGAVAEAVTLRTNRARALVPLDEIIPGGPPPDGIPAIDRPVFVAPAEAATWLHPREPVLAVEINGDARAVTTAATASTPTSPTTSRGSGPSSIRAASIPAGRPRSAWSASRWATRRARTRGRCWRGNGR